MRAPSVRHNETMDEDFETTDLGTVENEKTKSWVSDAFSISIGKFHRIAGPFESNLVYEATEIGIVTQSQTIYGAFGDRPCRHVTIPQAAFHFVPTGTRSKGVYENSSLPVFYRFSDDYLKVFLDHHSVNCAVDEPRTAVQLLRNADIHVALAKDFLKSEGFGGKLRAEALLNLILSDTLATMEAGKAASDPKALSMKQVVEITEYVDVEKAKGLLEATDESIASIAYDIGFSSQSHFTTTFKKVVGITPKAFRNIRSG